jgi:hypothetical protein
MNVYLGNAGVTIRNNIDFLGNYIAYLGNNNISFGNKEVSMGNAFGNLIGRLKVTHGDNGSKMVNASAVGGTPNSGIRIG